MGYESENGTDGLKVSSYFEDPRIIIYLGLRPLLESSGIKKF
jgi:hypothetical protein